MRFLVTGGAGFIGSHIVDALIDEGHKVVVVDDESANNKFHKNGNAENHKISVNCYDCLLYLMKDVDVVFHLAAESRVQNCLENPILAAKTNVVGTCNVLQAALQTGVKRVVYSSTSSAYGLINKPPTDEDTKVDCINPYASTKVAGELLCKNYSDLFGLETIIFRYFNVYGDRSPIKGQYAPLVGRFIDQYKKDESLTIVPDGSQRRDYVHVSDVVEANMVAAFKKDIESGEIYNVGSGVNYSVSEIADMISNQQCWIEPRDGEAQETLANISKIKKDLKWIPKVKLQDWVTEQIRIQNA
tara:strand:- start:1267 stop:2169 length:903 start_codon:yes stop_codon:yes gene_type:complete